MRENYGSYKFPFNITDIMIIAPTTAVVKRVLGEKIGEGQTNFKKALDKFEIILYYCVSKIIHF